ncbi:MAG: hypothetical protein IIC53_14060, partial [Proteobacteria bacterium]|nr:hypothetical protein [Pseudomonadota bacterium]
EAAQILLTLEDTEQRRRYLNARETLRTLLNLKTVPVINENDTVTTAEIRFGDNDRLAACVAGMIEADSLVLLSDIAGLYSADPRRDSGARHIAEVNSITPDIEAMAEGPASDASRGGMRSKIAAAKIATAAATRPAPALSRARPGPAPAQTNAPSPASKAAPWPRRQGHGRSGGRTRGRMGSEGWGQVLHCHILRGRPAGPGAGLDRKSRETKGFSGVRTCPAKMWQCKT